jgi:transcriptional regulator with XRE-family HTH domain
MAKDFSTLFSKMTPARQARVAARADAALLSMALADLRKSRGQSQVEMAAALRTTQASISKLERRADVHISSLRRYIQSLGGDLELVARFPDGAVRIDKAAKR